MSGYFAIYNVRTSKRLMENQHDTAVVTKPLIHAGSVIYCKLVKVNFFD